MREIARLLLCSYFGGFTTNCVQVSGNKIEIHGKYDFFIVSYDKILHRLSYHKVEKYFGLQV